MIKQGYGDEYETCAVQWNHRGKNYTSCTTEGNPGALPGSPAFPALHNQLKSQLFDLSHCS